MGKACGRQPWLTSKLTCETPQLCTGLGGRAIDLVRQNIIVTSALSFTVLDANKIIIQKNIHHNSNLHNQQKWHIL